MLPIGCYKLLLLIIICLNSNSLAKNSNYTPNLEGECVGRERKYFLFKDTVQYQKLSAWEENYWVLQDTTQTTHLLGHNLIQGKENHISGKKPSGPTFPKGRQLPAPSVPELRSNTDDPDVSQIIYLITAACSCCFPGSLLSSSCSVPIITSSHPPRSLPAAPAHQALPAAPCQGVSVTTALG